ncbi:MAG: hydrogenase maturation protein, partial [gamma proteobacterium symbiont of Bathyaustriella thionipta]|nr:hydrogenase maturation protein [gamma proteobacterium symbiont of Bathyaustriella thionipta]
MRILFLTQSFNSLTQRLYVELQALGHEVSVEFDINNEVALEAVETYLPDLIIAPFLKRAIDERIWRHHVCLIVHPGIRGDRGPSALDWAILNQETHWGVTVLQANHEMDGGDIWACCEFTMRAASKASLYRHEVTEAAVKAVLLSVAQYQTGNFIPQVLDYSKTDIWGQFHPLMKQSDRKINWFNDTSETILRKIHCADGFPGVQDSLFGRDYYLYDARVEKILQGEPGTLIARCGGAIGCRPSCDNGHPRPNYF